MAKVRDLPDCERNGLTVSTVGLFLRGLPEIRIDVNSPSLLDECEPFLRFVTDYLSQTGVRIEPGETMAYGYWLVKFQEAAKNLLEVSVRVNKNETHAVKV
jgi:hypothetical protein